jgi:predicted flap endonuclease-1-like 5' DNA nuclease
MDTTKPAAYQYPVTTVGIPRGAPGLVQPQIQTITLPAAPPTDVRPVVVAPTPATVEIKPAPAVTPVPPVELSASIDPARFDRALVGDAAQPRPEPLRRELGRSSSTPTTVPSEGKPSPELAQPAEPMSETKAPAPAAVEIKSTSAETPTPAAPSGQPFAPVAAGGAALAALAARAAASTSAANATPVSAPADATVAVATGVVGDDLTRIRTIDAVIQTRLRALGVMRLADIARWSSADVGRVSQSLGLVGRIEQENWIEQAQILATGGETDYSRRRLRGEIPVTPPTLSPASAPTSPASTMMPGLGSAPLGFEPAAKPATPTVDTVAVKPASDQALDVQSITPMASAAAAAVASAAAARPAMSSEAPMPTRLVDAIRENLTKPAANTSVVTPVPTAETARAGRPDLAGLRSVRSEALRPDAVANEMQRAERGRGMAMLEDLKRIRGIGVLIEKKLNSLGVSSYEQIANWTNADIDRVSQILDFKGRIERENWVEQARILASGGHTEFSRRVDRGEA